MAGSSCGVVPRVVDTLVADVGLCRDDNASTDKANRGQEITFARQEDR